MADENTDWIATSSIYIDANCTVKSLPFGGFCGSLEIPVTIDNVVFCQLIHDDVKEPRFEYWILDEPPVLNVSFHYHETEGPPQSIKIFFAHYPALWPAAQEKSYAQWLMAQAEQKLQEEEQSYAVCDFLEHEALAFFCVDHRDETHGYSLVVLPKGPSPPGQEQQGNWVNPLALPPWQAPNCEFTLNEYAKTTIRERWKHHFTMDCPICFETCSLGDGVEITCGHVFCHDCISMYTQYVVADLAQHNRNPFTCPVDDCRKPMLIVGCAKR